MIKLQRVQRYLVKEKIEAMKLQEGRYSERGSRRKTGNEKKIGEGEAGNQ
jgi:hypothetical protein